MELRYIILTIIKILLSVPAIVIVIESSVEGAALIKEQTISNQSTNDRNSFGVKLFENANVNNNNITSEEMEKLVNNYSDDNYSDGYFDRDADSNEKYNNGERIPNPSPLVVPGYNLPENIFNKGKPFYLEKDPETGKVNFNSKTSTSQPVEYDYYEDDLIPSETFPKSSIDRKDGELYENHKSHRPSDINQLTPNIHDFLNLPVKYNPEKHVYPLISSSYANTKIQGNMNKPYNHKDERISYSSYKTTSSPSQNAYSQFSSTKVTPSTTTPTTTTSKTTSKTSNLMESYMNHESYGLESKYKVTEKPKLEDIYLTTRNVNNIYLTTKAPHISSTTKRTLSLFEQLFGNFDDMDITEKPVSSSTTSTTTVTPKDTTTPVVNNKNNFSEPVSGPSTDFEYEYDDYYNSENDNIAVESNVPKTEMKPIQSTTSTLSTKKEKVKFEYAQRPSVVTPESYSISSYNSHSTTTQKPIKFSLITKPSTHTAQVTSSVVTSTTSKPTEKITSLPLGENHFGTHYNAPSVFSFQQNVRENLNKEKVPHIQTYDNSVLRPVPSSNNIRIPAHQDTVSFVVGNHQNVQGDNSFVETGNKINNEGNVQVGIFSEHPYLSQQSTNDFKESSFQSGLYRPFALESNRNPSEFDSVQLTVQTSFEHGKPISGGNTQKIEGSVSSVNLQPLRSSEASLAIGVPFDTMKKIPGQVVDEKLENENIKFAKKGSGAKIVFPKDEQIPNSSKKPINSKYTTPKQPNKEVLSLNSKPIFHQLPSDLTPPNESEIAPPRMERPSRPPWDPRPGHFHNGRPEYSRPPKPYSKYEPYKRIDSLPNILPQFRPNIKSNFAPHHMEHKYLRPPAVDRQYNRASNYFEKLTPPSPPKHLQSLRKLPPPPHHGHESEPTELKFQLYNQRHVGPPAITINPLSFTPKPPILKMANRRQSESNEIETLQMIQGKTSEHKDINSDTTNIVVETTQNPVYVVYPVKSTSMKLENDKNSKETVIIGTRAEIPLPPSQIQDKFTLNNLSNRDNDPILKPQLKQQSSNFPYRLEKPNIPTLEQNSNVPNVGDIISNNQWNSLDEDDASNTNDKNSNEISANLQLYTDKPIAVAYTPTDPSRKIDPVNQQNFGSLIIPEARDKLYATENKNPYSLEKNRYENHKIQEESSTRDEPPKLDFQAPFQASINLDSMSQGWTVVRNKEKLDIDRNDDEGTTLTSNSTNEFDIENFKPQLFGGFKPLYDQPQDSDSTISDRQER